MIRVRTTGPLRPSALLVGCASLTAIAGILWPHHPGVMFLYNDSASVPLGFWMKAHANVQLGTVIGFRPPPAAMPYVTAHMPQYAEAKLILKYVVAVAGDDICRTPDGTFSVDGHPLGRAAQTDSHGNTLPSWQGCHTLISGEVAVFSNHIPNSFDSRFYGIIPVSDIAGVYQPLWTWEGSQNGEQH